MMLLLSFEMGIVASDAAMSRTKALATKKSSLHGFIMFLKLYSKSLN